MFEKVCHLENLLKAYYLARRGKSEKFRVNEFGFGLEQNIIAIRRALQSGTYSPAPYMQFTVYDQKTRQISAPAFLDRVVHHSLTAVIDPLFEKKFIYDSYACRKGKGTHFGVKRVKKFLMAARCSHGRDKKVYVLHCDIRKYFQSISWDILISLIQKTIYCPRTLDLITKIITTHDYVDRNFVPDHPEQLDLFHATRTPPSTVFVDKRKGLPLGNLTSQLFANVYLNELDYFVKEHLRERWYARYMDDFLIIHPDRAHLQVAKERMEAFLRERLALELHPKKVQIKNVSHGVTFVGYRIFYDHVLVRGSTLLRMQKRYRKKEKGFRQGKIPQDTLMRSHASLSGHLKHANTHNLRKTFPTPTEY